MTWTRLPPTQFPELKELYWLHSLNYEAHLTATRLIDAHLTGVK